MALNEIINIAGINILPYMTEGEKSALVFSVPDILGKEKTNKETKEKTREPLQLAKRSINDVSRFFVADNPMAGRIAISELQLSTAYPAIHKAVKESGNTAYDFYLGMTALAESLAPEVEAKSASDPNVNIARAVATMFDNDQPVPTDPAEMKDLILTMVQALDEANLKIIMGKLSAAEEENGRFPGGQIRMIAQKAKKGEEKEGEEKES